MSTKSDTKVAFDPVSSPVNRHRSADMAFSMPSTPAPTTAYKAFLPRPDRVQQQQNPANAQGLYPPEALIFVANLSTQRNVQQLEASCEDYFKKFGPSHVKVRLDRNGHPFAFVQFHNVQDASLAVEGSTNLILDGRKIRIERAKAERAVILARVDGYAVSMDEAMRVLECFGAIEACKPANAVSAQNRAGTVYAKFAFWADSRDALRGLQTSSEYTLTLSVPPAETRLRWGPANTSRGYSTNPRSFVDQKSIFVGNLPDGATRQDLQEIFCEFGDIVQINVIRKEFGIDAVNLFGFVEFLTSEEAIAATTADRDFILHDTRLRVEPKEYSARRQRLTSPPLSTPMLGSMSNMTPRHSGSSHGMYRDFRNLGGHPGRQLAGWGNDFYANRLHHGHMNASAMGLSSFASNLHGPPFLTPPNSTLHGSGASSSLYSPSPYHHQPSSNVSYPNPIFNPAQYSMGPILETEERY